MNFVHNLASLAHERDDEKEREIHKIHCNVTFKNGDTVLLVVTVCCSRGL